MIIVFLLIVLGMESPLAVFVNRTKYSFQSIVWTYWDGEITPFVSRCLSITNSTLNRDWHLVIVRRSTLSQFLNDSTIPTIIFKLSAQQRADYIRLKLLHLYGGWWIDASVVITSIYFINGLVNKAMNEKAELTYFYHPYKKQYIENNIMFAPTGSIIITAWMNEMELMFHLGVRNYLYSISRKGIILPKTTYSNYPFIDTYFAGFACGYTAFNYIVPRNLSVVTLPSRQYPTKLKEDCHWSKECVKRRAMNDTALKDYPITKFFHDFRQYIDPSDTTLIKDYIDDYHNSIGRRIRMSERIREVIAVGYLFFLSAFFLQSIYWRTYSILDLERCLKSD